MVRVLAIHRAACLQRRKISCSQVYHSLKNVVVAKYGKSAAAVGDEGGSEFALIIRYHQHGLADHRKDSSMVDCRSSVADAAYCFGFVEI